VVLLAVKVTVGFEQLNGLVLPIVTAGTAVFSATVVDFTPLQPLTGSVAVKVYKPPCVMVADAEEAVYPFGPTQL